MKNLAKNLRFLCVGSATQDVFLSGGKEFRPEEIRENSGEIDENFVLKLGDKFNMRHVNFATGGGASDAATTFARHGFDVSFVGKVGNDPAANVVFRDFDREGIGTEFVKTDEKFNTDYSTLLLAPNGERTILTYRGAGAHFRENDFDFAEIFAKFQPDWVYFTGLAAQFGIYDSAFSEARKIGAKIAWNPGKLELAHPEKVKALLADVEVLSVNKEEAQMLVDGENLEELARKLANFVPTILITDGRNGSVALNKTSFVAAGLYDAAAKRVDATGAGDAFASGFVAKIAAGENLKNAVHFASANSASVVKFIGAKRGILTGREKLEPMKIDIRPANY